MKIENWTQRQAVLPDVVRMPSILAAELACPDSPTASSAPGTDGEDTNSHLEGSVATDDSVSHRHVYFFAYADALLGRINSHP
jgi:hypothetical protein